jgi:hypothetical protein
LVKKKVIWMETSVKGVASARGHFGLTKSVRAFYQKVVKVALQDTLPSEMFTYGVPYEASRTYRVMKSEFECRRSQAMVEAYRQALRGF